ncbi:hypothetical protein [Nocardia lasii]|uniref:Uncharacterized protein n=1 Tax=Nocardia lasii TaxID=1616107 RepID=A0ABW1JX76_9NOCA
MAQKRSRLQLDADAEQQMRVQAEDWGVTPAVAVALAVQAQSASPTVAQRAVVTLRALGTGTAVPWKELSLPTSTAPTLTLSMGAWVDGPSKPGDPISRRGHGVKPDWVFNAPEVVRSVRAYWSAAPTVGTFRIVAFRLGLPVAHLWADSYAIHGDRIFVDKCLVADSGGWVDADAGVVVAALDTEDIAVDQLLANLIVTPSKSRNPVSWLDVRGRRP